MGELERLTAVLQLLDAQSRLCRGAVVDGATYDAHNGFMARLGNVGFAQMSTAA